MRAAVLGRPIAHSLSPALHRAGYAALGLDWTYEAHDVGASELAAFLAACGPDWAGLSLTMPLKLAVLPLLDEITDLTADVGAVNTVLLAGGRRRGENTDVHGLVAALREAGVAQPSSPVVLGGGATARSAVAALAELGASTVRLAARREPVEAQALARRRGLAVTATSLDGHALSGAGLVISTLPAGAADALAPAARDIPALLDVCYAPWPTPLAAACRGIVVSGLAMLLHQAAAQLELMTGQPAPLDAMRAALPSAAALKG